MCHIVFNPCLKFRSVNCEIVFKRLNTGCHIHDTGFHVSYHYVSGKAYKLAAVSGTCDLKTGFCRICLISTLFKVEYIRSICIIFLFSLFGRYTQRIIFCIDFIRSSKYTAAETCYCTCICLTVRRKNNIIEY